MANITWETEPVYVGPLLIGATGSDFVEKATVSYRLNSTMARGAVERYVSAIENAFGRQVPAVAILARASTEQAFSQAKHVLDDMIGLVLLLGKQLDDLGIFSLRGPTNRPGPRGLAIDRSSLEARLGRDGSYELLSTPLLLTSEGSTTNAQWYSADPLPLDQALDDRLTSSLHDILAGNRAVHRRLRVCARWYSAAHWSDDENDAVLALGVALDSLVGTKSGLPGRAMRQRFGLLESDPMARKAREKRHGEIYGVRSAVAHGGSSSRLERIGGPRSIMWDVRWAAERLFELDRTFGGLEGEPALDGAFEDLRLGTKSWSY